MLSECKVAAEADSQCQEPARSIYLSVSSGMSLLLSHTCITEALSFRWIHQLVHDDLRI